MSSGLELPLNITRAIDAAELPAHVAEPLSVGIPLPQEAVPAVGSSTILDDRGGIQDVQASVSARWPDGSVKWILAEFAVPATSRGAAYLLRLSDAPQPDLAVLGTEVAGVVHLRSLGVTVRISPASGIQFHRQDQRAGSLSIECTDADGTFHQLAVGSVVLEWNGPQRATALARGRLGLQGGVVEVDLRLTTYAASPHVRCDLTVHNPRRAKHEGNCWELGDEGSVLFKQLAIVLRSHSTATTGSIVFSETVTQWECARSPVSIYQESSGGPNWNSPVHVDRSGTVPMNRPGFVVDVAGELREGLRAQPAVLAGTATESWGATLLRFWEEFPSAIRSSAGQIVVEPFPGAFPALHELQGGERKTRTCVFAHGSRAVVQSVISLAARPSFVAVDVKGTRSSGVLPFLDADQDSRHQQLLAAALEGESSFAAKRERIDEYGWRNFGDLHADHESAFLTDGREFVSHYNNQYDAIFGFGFQYLRTGDKRWWDLMDALARHVADIDIYHTVEDKAAYNGGMFWHTYHYVDAGTSTHRSYPRVEGVAGGGPAAEQNYSAGLALHYLMTGWTPSRNAAIKLGRWVIDMDDGSKTPFRWLTRARTGLATASGDSLYHGPGRAGGNSINALLVAFELTGDRAFLEKAEELIHRCIHPADDITALDLLDAERRWYYTVFLEAIGRYLWFKQERRELDANYDYARRALLHYARWMRVNEYPYLDRPEILEYPTETWSAQDVRKSEVLAWAALCERGPERAELLAASKRFLDDVLTRLPSLPTHTSTRPLVLMLARGYAYNWVSSHPDVYFGQSPGAVTDPPPSRFEPQKVIAMRRARLLAGILTGAVVLSLVLLLFQS